MNTRVFALVIAVAVPGTCLAGHGHQGPRLEKCLRAASEIKQGEFVKLEYLDPSADGVATYEIEVRDPSGREWEFMCDARKGRIYEIEQEVESADDPLFKKNAKITAEQARQTVLSLYPGEVEELEYEIESNGDPSYEIDVVDASGTEWKVEVDAATGKIIEVHVEKWEIGTEPEEEPK